MFRFAVLLACVALLLFSCSDDEPEPASPTAAEESAVTDDDLELFNEGWEAVDTDAQGLDAGSVNLIYGIPDRGFFAVNVFSWALHASPDGKEWFNADPQELIAQPLDYLVQEPIATTGDKVIIPNHQPPGVWMGDPLAGSWDLVAVDMTGLDRQPRLLAVAASDTEVLLVAALVDNNDVQTDDVKTDDVAVWVIDLATGTSQRHQLPESFTRLERTGPGPDQGPPGSEAIAAWVNGRWLVLPSWCSCSTIYSSVDGETWSESEMRWSSNGDPAEATDSQPGDAWYQSDAMATAGGREAIMISYQGGLPDAYSEDAATWLAVESELDAGVGDRNDIAYSDELGFITFAHESRDFLEMTDDSVWKYAGHAPSDVGNVASIAAFENKLLVISEANHFWLWTE